MGPLPGRRHLPNGRAGLAFSLQHGDAVHAGRYLFGLWFHWLSAGVGDESARAARAYLALDVEGLEPFDRLTGLFGADEIVRFTGHPDEAIELKEESLGLSRSLPDVDLYGWPVEGLAPGTLAELSSLELQRGSVDAARAYADEALELRRRAGRPHGVAHALWSRAAVALAEDALDLAHDLLEEGARIQEEVGPRAEFMMYQAALAEVELTRGLPSDAHGRLTRWADEGLSCDDLAVVLHVLRVCGMLLISTGSLVDGVTLVTAAQGQVAATGMNLFDAADLVRTEALLDRARAELGDDRFARAQHAATSTIEEASQLALRLLRAA